MAISPRSSTWGDPGEKPGTVAHRLHPGYGCSPDIRPGTDPAPAGGGGGAPQARAGWGGGRSIWVSSCEGAGGVGVPKECVAISCRRRRGQGGGCRQKGKMVGVWETGEGERVPPPRQPLPQWRYPPRSSTWGDPGEKPGTVAHRLHPVHGCSPDIATHGPRPRRGRGRSAAGAGGVGDAGEVYGYPPAKARGGVGVPAEVYGYPP